jgi:hypothetical protein
MKTIIICVILALIPAMAWAGSKDYEYYKSFRQPPKSTAAEINKRARSDYVPPKYTDRKAYSPYPTRVDRYDIEVRNHNTGTVERKTVYVRPVDRGCRRGW